MKKKRTERRRPFDDKEQRDLATVIRSLVPIARDKSHFMHKWARGHIGGLLWCWTVGAIAKKSGRLIGTAVKYNVNVHAATPAAIKIIQSKSNKGLRHEHAIPRSLIAKRIVDENMDEEAIVDFLRKFCRAVIIEKGEDDQLNEAKLRKTMPVGWNWDPNDVYARYRKVGLFDILVWPSGTDEVH